MFSSQLAELHSEGASVRSLQDALQALEQDKAALEERAERLEKELAAAKSTLTLPSGKLSGFLCAPVPVPWLQRPLFLL